jgi:CubicO group peptidase (beta-lactamase class C family)
MLLPGAGIRFERQLWGFKTTFAGSRGFVKMRRMIIAVRVMCVTVLLAAFPFRAGAITNALTLRENQNGGSYQYRAPEKTNDGWETGSLSSANLDAGLINEFFERLNAHYYTNTHSVLLVRSNKLVVEEYFPGPYEDGKYRTFNRDTLHTVQSATKSVNSLLIGIAIEQHLIQDVDEKISTFFPEFTGKDNIRLRHFLSMSAGLAWNEHELPYTDARNNCIRMNHTNDPVHFALERASVAAPGTRFAYNSGISVGLGEIIRKASGLPADKFAERNLFKPLGISN